MPRPPTSSLFPYTTLFRSCPETQSRANTKIELPAPRCTWTTRLSRFAASAWSGLPSRVKASGAGEEKRRRGYCLSVRGGRSEEHTSELQSLRHLVCRLLLE